MIPGFLTRPLLGGLCALLLALLAVQTVRIDGLLWIDGFVDKLTDERAAHELTRADLTTCRSNTRTLEQSIADQNAAIDSLKSEADRIAAAAADAVAEAERAAANRHRRTVAELTAARPGADACQSAAELIDRTIAGERQ